MQLRILIILYYLLPHLIHQSSTGVALQHLIIFLTVILTSSINPPIYISEVINSIVSKLDYFIPAKFLYAQISAT